MLSRTLLCPLHLFACTAFFAFSARAVEVAALPSQVYGYYESSSNHSWDWLAEQLPFFEENERALFLSIHESQIGDEGLLDLLWDAQSRGVEVRAWVLVDRDKGFYANDLNAEHYAATALNLAEWLADEGHPLYWIVVDMETDVVTMAQLWDFVAEGDIEGAMDLLARNRDPAGFSRAAAVYQQMVVDLRALDFRTMVVTFPQVLDDLEDRDVALQDMLNIPVSMIDWDEISVMVYTGEWSQMTGLDFDSSLAYSYAQSLTEYFPRKASFAVGIPGYGNMQEPWRLEGDIGAVKAAGIDRIQVFSYDTTIAQADPMAWDAAFEIPASVPPMGETTILVRRLARVLDRLF